MGIERLRTYSPAEQDRVLGTQNDLIAKLRGVLRNHDTDRVERLVGHAPLAADGRVGVHARGPGFADQELRVLFDGSMPGVQTVYLMRPYGETIARPYSKHSDFGVPLGEPAGTYEALRLELAEDFSANRLSGLASDWEECDGLSLGNPLGGCWPDTLILANVCYAALNHPNTFEAATPIPKPTGN